MEILVEEKIEITNGIATATLEKENKKIFWDNNINFEKPAGPYRMGSRKDLDALCEQAHQEYLEGKTKRLSSVEEINKFFEEL